MNKYKKYFITFQTAIQVIANVINYRIISILLICGMEIIYFMC